MTIAKPFVVISNAYRDTHAVPRWALMEFKRETEKRLYLNEKGTVGRFHDTYENKDKVVARFDTREEAVAFMDGADKVWRSHDEEMARATDEVSRAKKALVDANNNLASAVAVFIKESGGA